MSLSLLCCCIICYYISGFGTFYFAQNQKKGQTFGVPKFGRMFECCAPEILFLSVLQRVESKNDRQAKSFIAKFFVLIDVGHLSPAYELLSPLTLFCFLLFVSAILA